MKLGAIGDVLMVLPAARLLWEAGYTVDWIAGDVVAPILRLYPWLNVLAVDEHKLLRHGAKARSGQMLRLWRALLGRGPYDLCATLYYDRRYRWLTLPVRARRKLLLSGSDRFRRILPGRRHTDEFARLLLNLPDAVTPRHLPPIRPTLFPAYPMPPTGKTRIILAPAGARNMMAEAILRRWPAELYVALTQLLLAAIPDAEILLIGGPDDTWVSPHFAPLPVTDLIGTLSLTQTIALLDTAAIFVTHDTGPLHLAGLTSTSILALFGPTDPHAFLPQRPGVTSIWGGEGFACRPCYDGRNFAPCPANDCMRQITPQQALEAALQILAERASNILAPPRILTPPSTIQPQTLVPFP